MRYRITLVKDSLPVFEAVVYRDFEEPQGGENEPPTARKIASITRVQSELAAEMSYQAAFAIKSIEEVPAD